MTNKTATKLVRNDQDLARLVAGDRVELNLGGETFPAAYVGQKGNIRGSFVARLTSPNGSLAVVYEARGIDYDNNGVLTIKSVTSTECTLGNVHGSLYGLLVKAGLVRE